MPTLTCQLLNFELNSPLVLAANPIGIDEALMVDVARHGAGLITAKSCTLNQRAGHPLPVEFDWGGGLLNAIGLKNPGAETYAAMLTRLRPRLAEIGVPLMGSIAAGTVDEFAETAQLVLRNGEPDLLEINISCPNVGDEYGTPFSGSPESAAQVTVAVRQAVDCPIMVKLAPNVPSIARIAKAVEAAGADGITAINTVPGMVIATPSGQPAISNRVGGISGAAVKPVALRAVYEISQAVSIPVIGVGGMMSGRDVAEMLMAGATAVGVATAVYQQGPAAMGRIQQELTDFMTEHQFDTLDSLRGLSHQV